MCHVLSEPGAIGGGGVPAELTLTDLYAGAERLMLRQFCRRQGEDLTVLTCGRLEELTGRVVATLSYIAYAGMKEGGVIIPRNVVWECMTRNGMAVGGEDDNLQAWVALTDSGLLQRVGDASNPAEGDYQFLHLTLQEYFAAKRVCEGLLGGRPLDDGGAWLRANKYLAHLEVMWWFVGGCVGRAAVEGGNVTGLENLAVLWREGVRELDPTRRTDTRVWLRMAEEARVWRLGEDSVARAPVLETMLSALRECVCVNVRKRREDEAEDSELTERLWETLCGC